MSSVRGCLGAGEGPDLPQHLGPPAPPPQPGGRHGQAGTRAHQSQGSLTPHCLFVLGLDRNICVQVRTPGRSRAGYVVYLAYQLVESVTYSQVMLDTVFYAVDIEVKKKQVTFPSH